MKYASCLIVLATLSLAACGESDEAPVTPSQPEPAPIVAAEPVGEDMIDPAVPPAASAADPIKVSPPAQPTPAPPAPATEPEAVSAQTDLAHGQKIYRQACAFCHDKGVAGAPTTGDAVAWSLRLAQGIDSLYTAALNGKGAMPARGGNPSLTDADVKAAVDHIMAHSR